jgi:hypothetical protein
MSMLSLWPLFAIAVVVGLGLAWLGWRGRRVDDHPLCRRCQYDLVGSEPSTETCPECGADLTPPRAVCIGHRRRLRLVLAIGMLMLLAALGGGGAIGWGIAKGFDFNPYKPLWMLRSEATSGSATNPKRAAAAEQEILARLTNRKLSSRQITSIVDEALLTQSDLKATWHPWLGDFIEQAWLNQDISDDLAMKYVRQAVEQAMRLEVSPRVREGGMLRVTLNQRPMRAGRTGTFVVDTEQKAITLEDGTLISPGGVRGRTTVAIGSSGSSSNRSNIHLPLGKHTASMETDVRVGLASQWGAGLQMFTSGGFTMSGSAGGRSMMRQFQRFNMSSTTGFPGAVNIRPGPGTDAGNEPEPLAEWTLTQRSPLEVMPPGTDLVASIKDEALGGAILRSAVVERCQVLRTGSFSLLDCAVSFSDSPAPVAFDVYARVTDAAGQPKEWLVGSAVHDGRGEAMSLGIMNLGMRARGPMVPDFPKETSRIDLVLRTNKRLAEDSNFDRVWDGEIVIRDVPIERLVPPVSARSRSRGGPV